MHAIVLIGGFGTRLRPLTDTVPKSMLTVGNEPIITRLVRRLGRGGVTTVTLSLGYLPDAYLGAFPDDRCGDVQMRYAVEPEPLDTAGAIRFAAEVGGVDGTFLVVNGDVICDLDVAALVAAHRRSGALATHPPHPGRRPVRLRRRRARRRRAGAALRREAGAGGHRQQPDQRRHVRDGADVLDLIEPGRRVSVERETFPALVDGRVVVRPRHRRLLARRRQPGRPAAGQPRPARRALRRRPRPPGPRRGRDQRRGRRGGRRRGVGQRDRSGGGRSVRAVPYAGRCCWPGPRSARMWWWRTPS